MELSTEQGVLFGEGVARGEKELESETTAGTPSVLGGTVCNFCGLPVDASDPTVYEEIISWVAGKKKDSAVLRTRTGRCACPDCINKLRSGIAPDQRNLVESLDAQGAFDTGEYNLVTDRSPAYLAGFSDGWANKLYKGPPVPESVDEMDYFNGYSEGKAQREAQDFLGGASQ